MDAPVRRMLAVAAVILIATQLAIRCSDAAGTVDDRVAAAKTLAAEGRADEAVDVLSHATAEFPGDPRAWTAYGDALLELLADAPGADYAYRRGCAADAVRDVPSGVAFRRRGLLAWACGRLDEAESALRRAAAAGDAPGGQALALMLCTLRRPAAAEALAQARAARPADARLLLCAAAEAAIAGQRDQAAAWRGQALDAAGAAAAPEGSADGWVRYLCARADAASGDRARAARCLSRAGGGPPATAIADRPPLTRADLLADPAFAHPDAALAAAIAAWPERPPLSTR